MAETGGRVQPQPAGSEARQKRWMSVEEALKLAREMLQAGRLAEAEKIAQDVADARGNNADAVHILGIIAYRQNRLERAIKLVERAIELAPNVASFHANLAEMYRLRGRPELGLASGERAVSLDPANIQGWNNLGIIHFDRGDFAKAEFCYRKAIAGQESFAHAWNNLGNALVRLDREAEAHDAFARAIALLPSYSEAMVNDGLSYREEGRLELAEERLRQGIQANPQNANARVSLAMLRMLQGDIRGGLPEYEWRLALPEIRRPNLPGQPWRGESLEGKRVFVYAEQGLGDVLHYLRFLRPLSMRRPASIVVQVQANLQRLVEINFPFATVIRNAPAAGTVDLHCALMSLPLLLGFPVATAEAPAAYLSAPSDQVEAFRTRFAAYPGLKVGLVWAGNSSHKYDYNRSMSAEHLLPLLEVKGCQLFSLQIGNKAADAQLFKDKVIDLSKEVSNMMSTSGAIAALDLVIAVDTSLAHLAGALGTPIWTLLSHVPDWRWGLAGETTALYRSMRLFRQPRRRDWPTVIAAVADALAEKAAAHSKA